MAKRKIVDAKADSKGNITPVKIQSRMMKQGLVDAVVVKPKDAKEHLRTKPDKKIKNNLDEPFTRRLLF